MTNHYDKIGEHLGSSYVTGDPVGRDQSKFVGDDGKLRYRADNSEVFPGATGVRHFPPQDQR